jgi:hypothetical protein
MKKLFIALLIVAIVAGCQGIQDEENANMKKWIGEEIVIAKDTLVVMGYSTLGLSLYLSDGRSIDYSFAKKYFEKQKK